MYRSRRLVTAVSIWPAEALESRVAIAVSAFLAEPGPPGGLNRTECTLTKLASSALISSMLVPGGIDESCRVGFGVVSSLSTSCTTAGEWLSLEPSLLSKPKSPSILRSSAASRATSSSRLRFKLGGMPIPGPGRLPGPLLGPVGYRPPPPKPFPLGPLGPPLLPRPPILCERASS